MTPEEQERANQAFAALETRVKDLEALLKSYKEPLEHLKKNYEFFTDLTSQLNKRFLTVEAEVTRLNSKIGEKELTKFRDDLLTTISALVQSPSKDSVPFKPKVDAPVPFSGKREDWKTFQAQLELFFLHVAPTYPKDGDKILYSISRLGETGAFKFMEPYIKSFKLPEEERPLLISDLATFFKTMSKTFGIANAHVLAESQLRALKQKGSALDYTNKFVNLAADTKWNDAAMISQYRLGLKENVQETMATLEEPETFSAFSQLAIDIDNRHYGYVLTKGANRSTSNTTRSQSNTPQRTAPTTSSTASPPSMAMDLSQAQHRAIPAQEKQRRHDNNLCHYCGEEDHFVKNCPNKSKFNFRSSASVSTIDTSDDVVFNLGKDNA
jgi:hypothetical protein